MFGKERTIGPWKNVPRFYPVSELEMQEKYRKAKNGPGYARLRQSAKVPPRYPLTFNLFDFQIILCYDSSINELILRDSSLLIDTDWILNSDFGTNF